MSARHRSGCDTRGGNWICAAGCPVAAQRTEKEATMPERTIDSDPLLRVLTSEQFRRMFDLHVDVLRASRHLDDAFPPYTGTQLEAVRDRAERLRDRAEALRALFDDDADGATWCGGRHPGACHVPDSTGVCELSPGVTPPAEPGAGR